MKSMPTMTPEELAAWEPGITGFVTREPDNHGYTQYVSGCRCEICTTACRERSRIYRANNREWFKEWNHRAYLRRKEKERLLREGVSV